MTAAAGLGREIASGRETYKGGAPPLASNGKHDVLDFEQERMMARSHSDHPEDDTADRPPMPTQAELEAMLDAGEIDVAAGRVVPSGPVLARMRATAERIRRDRDPN